MPDEASKKEALKKRIKSALITLKEVQSERGGNCIVKYGASECMKVSEAIRRANKKLKELKNDATSSQKKILSRRV